MKKIIALLLAIALIAPMCFATSAAEVDNQRVRLSELSEEESIEFIVSRGLEIPNELLDYSLLGGFIKYVVTTVEANPNKEFVINDRILFEFANQIKSVVNEYYGVSYTGTYALCATDGASQLRYSTLYGVWLNEYYGYNCYSYAIGQTRPFDGTYILYRPGEYNPGTDGDYSPDMDVAEMAELTVSDLEYLGYSCVITVTSYNRIMEHAGTHNIVCLRKGESSTIKDFHYMKLTGSGWLHKPGNTHVLAFNYLPYEIDWYAEGVRGDGQYLSDDFYYTGDIHYFAFRSNHDLTSAGATGEHYHQGSLHYYQYRNVCEDCGAIIYYWESVPCSGPPCSSQIMGLPNEETQ